MIRYSKKIASDSPEIQLPENSFLLRAHRTTKCKTYVKIHTGFLHLFELFFFWDSILSIEALKEKNDAADLCFVPFSYPDLQPALCSHVFSDSRACPWSTFQPNDPPGNCAAETPAREFARKEELLMGYTHFSSNLQVREKTWSLAVEKAYISLVMVKNWLISLILSNHWQVKSTDLPLFCSACLYPPGSLGSIHESIRVGLWSLVKQQNSDGGIYR